MRLLEFPLEEIQARIQRLQQSMENAELAGTVITAESNFYYFSGYRTHTPWSTFARAVWLFVPAKGSAVLLVHRFVEPEAQARSAVTDVRCYDSLTGTPLDQVVEIIAELGMDRGRIGWELGYEQRLGVAPQEFEGLRRMLPLARFEDASALIWSLRMIKSVAEIACLRQACQATDWALSHIFAEIREGMTEKEISRRASALMLGAGAEAPGFVIIVSGEGNYERISGIATNRRIERGDMVWLDLSAVVGGYWTDYCRAGVVGGPTDEQRKLQAIVHEVTMKAVAKIAPGVPVAEIARECARGMQEYGFDPSFDCGRMGHGIGLNSTEPPHVATYDNTILQPGMTITVEPGIVNERGVFDIEENVAVTERGYEILSKASRELHTISGS
ncbi:MAG: Xaa-Pro peptidase family protein [Chloroflexi bacterium]|nr:Xaa-Pro peptidase family protein [Chloroflexota bacterium]